uniref:CCHC-type domain-containing protein n=1 Tax=Setaria italica TaxID=4555 RepID=K3Y301_SETIT
MDLIHGELEHFIMLEEETMTQMFDRLMLLISDIRTLRSTDWDDHKVTKKMLRVFTPRNPTLATMIRRDSSFKMKTPNQLLGEILHQELVERYVAKSLSMRMNKSLALNASSNTMSQSSPKALKEKKEDSSEEGSTDEETAFAIRNYKKFLKKKTFKKSGDDRKKSSQRRCYECKEVDHFITDCPHRKKKEMEEKRFKDKSKDYKKKYQGQAHVGQEWDSSEEQDNKEGIATLAILNPTTPTKLFNNISDNEDDAPFCLMAKGIKDVKGACFGK